MTEETTTSRKFIFEDDYSALFKWPEYLVFASVLTASMGIGIFYGFFSKKNSTNEEFLMAGRSMSILPVTLSLLSSFVSGITLLGEPVEVYFFGLIYIYFAFAFIPMTIAVSYLYLPVFCKLRLTSAYEYFERRFNRKTRMIISTAAIIHLLLYMPVTVWAPSLAIDQVAGLNKYWTSATIFVICIIYSSIGGLKAVLWSDALQATIMFGTIITIIVLGVKEVGGLNVVWERAEATGRTDVLNFDTDLRTRHTFWTGIIAAFFSWLPLFAGTQAQIQRYLSVPGIKEARQCLFLNMIGLLCVISLTATLGLLIFSNYYTCDPASLDTLVISSSDQLVPLFVMDVLGSYRGLPGLLVAGLTCDTKLGYLSKIISAIGGTISFALIFIIAAVGNILPGTFLGPIVALFSLGFFFPFANSLGSMLGVIPALVLTLFFGLGSILSGNAGNLPNQKLPLRNDGCYLNNTEEEYIFSTLVNKIKTDGWKDKEYSGLTNAFAISYLWLPVITILSTIFFGLLFSAIVNMFKASPPVKSRYMTPIILSMWVAILGKKRLESWVEFEIEDENDIADDSVKNVTYDVGTIPQIILSTDNSNISKVLDNET